MRFRSSASPLVSLIVCLGAVVACSGSSGAAATSPSAHGPIPSLAKGHYANWPTYHGGALRHGVARSMPPVRHAPHVVKTLGLDGQVYASPIVIGGTVIVATENDTVYAFGPKLHQLWKRHLGTPSPTSQRPCGDIDPLGITGTPVYDPKTNSVYVAPEFSAKRPYHQLVALNLDTGRVRWRKTLDFPGVDRVAMQERGALTLTHGRVYVPFGGLAGDCGAYKGRVVGRLATTGGKPIRYTVPTAREAGIWTPPGPTVDRKGHLFVAVGNGASASTGKYDHSDSVLRLSPRLKLQQSFSPVTWRTDNANDLDLGSQGPAILGKWIFSAGKSGTAYVLRRDHLGGIGGSKSHMNVCASYGGTAVLANVVYVPCTDGVRAVAIDKTGHMHIRWHADSSITGSPVIGGGRLWSLDTAGTLYALGLKTGKHLGSVAVGATSRFATPAIYGPELFVPTLAGLTVVSTR